MSVAPNDRIRLLVEDALRRPAHTRLIFLQTACGADAHLLDTVTALLADASALESALTTIDSTGPRAATPAAGSGTRQFSGTSRFVVERKVGQGGFGDVYQVRDTAKQERVALKTLQYLTADSLYRFKREFRSLADVAHRNLVQLYELAFEDDYWFFTMELIDGVHFLGRSGGAPMPLAALETDFRQLVEGLSALHDSGYIHRDVKPSNVLRARDGRVVVVDFGLAMDVHDDARQRSVMIAGTPAYMSPEQAAGLTLTAASDWYAVGVMLYEALTGRAPFSGPYLQVLTEKQRADPAAPRISHAEVPPHLDELCMRLLERDPERRPAADEILARLAASQAPHRRGTMTASTRGADVVRTLVAREPQLGSLDRAFQRMCSGMPTVAAVSGSSGIGKSTLVRTFLARVATSSPGCVVLSGRCYERESVPYKALDSLVDATAKYLNGLPEADAEALLPRDTGALSLLFPVLRDLRERMSARALQPLDPREARRRGSLALRDLLARISERHPLVLFADDLQWGDLDSATLLSEVLRPPDAPVMLFIAAYRDVEIETSPFLRSFLTEDFIHRASFQRVHLDPLSANDAAELAVSLLSSGGRADAAVATAIAAESGGSPFFIAELVRFAELSADFSRRAAAGVIPDTDAREASLAQMIQIRLSRMGDLQRVLQLAAVNGRPIAEATLRAAAGVATDQELAVLRAEHLLRGRQTSRGTEFEPYHDRIREIVVASLAGADLKECHRRLAAAYETDEHADPELLAQHHLSAGDVARALHYTVRAAEAADRALAFDRAVRLFRQALHLAADDPGAAAPLWPLLGRALTNAGRCLEAATVYDSLRSAPPAQALQFKTQAAQQFLFGGRLDDGLRATREVLGTIGMAFPERTWETLGAWLVERARLRVRGLQYRERPRTEVPEALANAVDACWSIAAGLSIVDTIRAAVFQTRHLRLALEGGDIEQVHRALCLETAITAATGPRASRHVRRLSDETATLSRRLGTPYARALHAFATGAAEYLVGNWPTAIPWLAEAEALFTDQCTGVVWELDSVRFFALWCQYLTGELDAMAPRVRQLAADASQRQDLYATTALRALFAHWIHLAQDDPASASRDTREAMQSWSQQGFHLPQLWELWSHAEVALYEGRGGDALQIVQSRWGELRRSLLLYVHYNAVIALDLRARAELAAALDPALTRAASNARQRQASRRIRGLRRQRAPWASALADLADAGLQCANGLTADALSSVTRAEHAFAAAGMHLHAAVARRRRGELLGGDAGDGMVAESDGWMQRRGIKNPPKMARMIAPSARMRG